MVARGGGRGNGELLFNGCDVSIWEDNDLEMDDGDGCIAA